MTDLFVAEISLHWLGTALYAIAMILVLIHFFFHRPTLENNGFRVAGIALLPHFLALLIRWFRAGHGPYISRSEVLSSNAWVAMGVFLFLARDSQRIRQTAFLVFPAIVLLAGLSVGLDPGITFLPPSLRSTWLIFHVLFYKIALGTILIALAFSLLIILKTAFPGPRWEAFPQIQVLDGYLHRFSGFGFTFWTIGMLAGSIWAYQSWGRFWAWDPIETWSFLTWMCFGIHLHLRRFFNWKELPSAVFFFLCVLFSLVAMFFVPLFETSIHSEYFK